MPTSLHLSFQVDGQANPISACPIIVCASVYPRTFSLVKKDGPQDLDVAIDVDLAAGILIFAGCRMRLTIAGLAPFEVSPQRPFLWLRESIFECPLKQDVKTIGVEILDGPNDAEHVLEIRVPELARRVKKTPPAAAPAPSLVTVAAVDPPIVLGDK